MNKFIFVLTLKSVLGGCRNDNADICESICSSKYGNYKCELRALVLLPDNNFYESSLDKALPVLQIAEDFIYNSRLMPSFIKIKWLPHDSKCDSSIALVNAMDGISKNCSHVMFGPLCDYPLASVGRIAKYLHSEGTPVISVGGAAFDFTKKKISCADEFYMLLRLGMLSFKTLAEFNVMIMKQFNWNHVVLFHEKDGQRQVAGDHTCYLMMQSLAKEIRKENLAFSSYAIDGGKLNYTMDLHRELGLQHAVVIMCADPKSIRRIMLSAQDMNMIDSGEYVFINIELFSKNREILLKPWFDANDTLENNEKARNAYTALLTVTPEQPSDFLYANISKKIKKIAYEKYNYQFEVNETLSTFVTSFYDGVILYATALNESIREDPTVLTRPFNGTDIVRRMWNRTFSGITGNVTIDANGDRISSYSLLDLNPETGNFEIIATLIKDQLIYLPGRSIHWAGGRKTPPPEVPKCGFDGSLCPNDSLPEYAIVSLFLGFIVLCMTVGSVIGYHHYKSEAAINSMTWKISYDEVTIPESVFKPSCISLRSMAKRQSQYTLASDDIASLAGEEHTFIPVGFYRSSRVAIKPISVEPSSINRSLMLELKRMKDLQHENLVKFYGACIDGPRRFLLTEYCPKGSLQEILENNQIQLDWMFKISLMQDIVRGMNFLHHSEIKSHGNLKSSNCVVDSRFNLKVTDFGLHYIRNKQYGSDDENSNAYVYWKQLLWTSPELLKTWPRPLEGSQKGDVYAFAIIVHEILTREGPFFLGPNSNRSPQDIINLVKSYPDYNTEPFRPSLQGIKNEDIKLCMIKCWSQDPNDRPDFNNLKNVMRKLNRNNETGNIVDNLLHRMEQYANNLEEVVQERTQDYLEEKKKCEQLLYQLLPQSVAAQLISGKPVVAETFDEVTIYFSDIVGFTSISAQSTPMEVVKFLNDLYTCFDSIVEHYDVYKVETIGDAYMVVSGLPVRNGIAHAREIARLSLDLLNAVNNFKIHHRPDDPLKLRIGLHSGPCVAGVVGLKMPRYCLFGDTVNTASRMESNGEALKIHISENTKLILDQFGTFITKERGYVGMKGKGNLLTYWLEGEDLPDSQCFYNSKQDSLNENIIEHDYNVMCNKTEFNEVCTSLTKSVSTSRINNNGNNIDINAKRINSFRNKPLKKDASTSGSCDNFLNYKNIKNSSIKFKCIDNLGNSVTQPLL
ncbi:NPR2 family protein [Megaselia abdita]